MTVLVDYVPESYAVTEDGAYTFTLEHVGPEAIEIYEVDSGGVRTLVPVSSYGISYRQRNLTDAPLKRGGQIQFTTPHSDSAVSISVERNTRIDQTLDFPTSAPFPETMVEFIFDKAIMICQEIGERKCNAETTVPILQPINFLRYGTLRAEEVDYMMQRIFDILYDFRNSADSCSAYPEYT